MGTPKRGDPYGSGRFDVGHPDHTARQKMESGWVKNDRAAYVPPNVRSNRFESNVPPTRPASRGPGALAKFVFLLLAAIFFLWLFGHR